MAVEVGGVLGNGSKPGLVMGAVSRRGLKRLFIGSTAERTIDRAPCDVLVVKQRRFKTTVPRRPIPAQFMFPQT